MIKLWREICKLQHVNLVELEKSMLYLWINSEGLSAEHTH